MTSTVFRYVCILVLAIAGIASAQERTGSLTSIQAGNITLQVPESWKSIATTSGTRLAQFEIPNPDGDQDGAELVVYYFGGPTGGTKANLERWIGQFEAAQRQVTLSRGTCRDGSYFLADLSGTWNKPDGPPVAQKTIATPNSRVMGVVLVTEKPEGNDYYFIKLTGPNGLVSSQSSALRTAVGADPDSEKPLRLEDVPD
jgi:hypothetical protein